MNETVTIAGRTRVPLWKKLNPIWWFLNDFEPDPPPWYEPDRPLWLRALYWYARNPFQNAGRYVLGVADRNYTVSGERPVMPTVWEDVSDPDWIDLAMPRRSGWKFSSITLEGGGKLPWVSYATPTAIFYAGWQPNGFCGLKFNRRATWFIPLAPFLLLALIACRISGR